VGSLFIPAINAFFVSFLKIPADGVYFFVDESSSIAINIFLDWASVFFGVFFVFELMSIASSDKKLVGDKLFQFFSVLFAAVAGFSIIFFARQWEFKEEEAKYQIQSQRIVDAIQSRIDEQVAILNVLRNSFFTVSVTEESFRLLTYDFVSKFKTIQAIEWAPRVRGQVRGNFVALARNSFPGFEIKSKSDDNSSLFYQAGDKHEYFPITYIQPYDKNQLVQGFDLLSSVIRRDAVYRSLSNDDAVSTAPIRLIQDGDRGFGILLMQHAISKDGSDGVILFGNTGC
jgi:CHASE1-domain containing sensor protein